MNKDSIAPATNTTKTIGVGTFGEGDTGSSAERLFRVQPGHSADFALEQAAMLMSCVYKLTLQAGIQQDGSLVWAAHYLSGMSKALVEDVAHAMLTD
ncbi:DUF3077 domain-containing protein [Pseudomonas aegrilactucae]|uniref:DUF3077 domain-containing protein n=1 Tax=Pseudomonas aegrilactucae TaxID=2854028 RepID=A0A9Q3AGG1_9PSED|nr:DUF3077 domain-containing protein [Pseudomonas aegrilactucae]MBV6289310.1 DUF3077 domain-containing protein [Pseudomonas aegrilactucae]